MIIKLHDKRIAADNYTTTIKIGKYLNIAKAIIDANEFQRKRVRHSASVYSLLKKDILEGCVIPPIVLAYLGDQAIPDRNIDDFLEKHSECLVILDGLQRTYTLIDARAELNNSGDALFDSKKIEEFLERETRIEFYAGINRIGILYRMLTLNTGQTPMTLRQQVEMLYHDYARTTINGVTLIREVEDQKANGIGQYGFKDIIDGFNSYLERNELPIDKFDLLENIQNLKNLSSENQKTDLFAEFVSTYHKFIVTITSIAGAASLSEEEIGIEGMPFGKNAFAIFSKPQVISGLGAALGSLKDSGAIPDFHNARSLINSIRREDSPDAFLIELLKRLESIRLSSKKIGNAQRMFFQYFFRALLNPESLTHLSLSSSVTDAHRKYQSQVL
jgi:hypothetical protein